MINLEEIDKAILELESHDTTYATCEKLAWLYIVKDHISGNTLTRKATPNYQSEFLAAATNCEIDRLMKILDEHFEVVKAIFPKEYEKVIQRIMASE